MTSLSETHEDQSSLARDSVGTTLTNGVLFLLGIILLVLIARLLGPTWRGALVMIMLAPTLVMRLGPLGYDQGMVVLGGADRKLLGPLTRTAVIFGFFLGLIFIGLLMGFMWGWPKTFWRISQIWLPDQFELIALVFPVHLMTMAFDSAIYAEDRISARNLKELIVNLVMLAIILVAVMVWKLKLFGVVGAYVIANLVSMVYAWILVKGRVDLNGGVDLPLAKRTVKLGFPIYLSQLASYVTHPAMMVILSWALGGKPGINLARIAFFSMGFQMVERILPVTRSVAFALFPKITKSTHEDARELAAKASRHTFIASVALFGLLVIFLHPVIRILLGEVWLPIVWPFAIMAPGGVALSVAGVWATHLLARKKPYKVAWAGITGFITALIIAALGFKFLQRGSEIIVASFAVVIGSFINASLLLPAFCSASGLKPSEILIPRMSDLKEWRRIPGIIGDYVDRKFGRKRNTGEHDR